MFHQLSLQIHYHILLISTAFVGASSFILGVDCFTTAGLKEVSHAINIECGLLMPSSVLYMESRLQWPVPQIHQERHSIPGLANHAD